MPGLKRAGIDYREGDYEPCNWSRARVESYAQKVAEAGGFKPGDDLAALVARLGGTLHYRHLGELGDGSIYVHGRREFDIVLPAYTSPRRDQFTVAHELGHYFLHADQGQTPIIAYRVVVADRERSEWEANWFAAALLMPADVFLPASQATDDLGSLAVLFNVSRQAAEVRKKVLGRPA